MSLHADYMLNYRALHTLWNGVQPIDALAFWPSQWTSASLPQASTASLALDLAAATAEQHGS
jgi:hypothetical protein